MKLSRMDIKEKFARAGQHDYFLRTVFAAVLVLRFFFPFFYNPYNSRYGQMQQNLDNGAHLLNPAFASAATPKGFEVWTFLLQLFPSYEMRAFTAFFTGLLCIGMAWFWYKALREITTRRKALIIATVTGLHPSLLALYAFYMTETLSLVLITLAAWTTLRSVRKRTLTAYAAAAACWICAVLTQPSALLLLVPGLGYALLTQPRRGRALALTLVIALALGLPAGLQGMQGLGFFAPLGATDLNHIGRISERVSYGVNVREADGRSYNTWWAPASFYTNLLDPFADYISTRSNNRFMTDIDTAKGRADWDSAMLRARQSRTTNDLLRDYRENLLFLTLGYSWPDTEPPVFTSFPPVPMFRATSTEAHAPMSLIHFGYQLRWLWPPCFILLLFYAPFARLEPAKMWIVLTVFFASVMFLLQDLGVVEGHSRKLLEPFLITSVFFLIESWQRVSDEGVSLRGFLTQLWRRKDGQAA